MANNRSNNRRQPQRRRTLRLFQSDALTAIFGRSVGTMITRSILTVVAVGLLVIVVVGLLSPQAAPAASSTSSSSTSSTSQPAANVPVGLQVGDLAPNFTLSSLNGRQVSLNDFRGKPVMLNFWFATCPGCLQEIPGMQSLYASQQAAGKDFVILGVNSVDDAQTARDFVQTSGLTYQMVLDNNQSVARLYNLGATPTSYFIDRQGIIRAVVVGPVVGSALQQNVANISQ